MPEHPGARPIRTAVRATQGAWDAPAAVGTAGEHTEPVLAARVTAMDHRRRIPAINADVHLDDHTGALGGIPIRYRNHQNRNQGKDHPMQDAGLTMRQEDRTQASPARNAIAHRTLSTPHARATSCRRYTGIPAR